ncbi:MAG: hypothetical protein WCF44_04550, partial [Candidatus Methylophosphatis roskildensis]
HDSPVWQGSVRPSIRNLSRKRQGDAAWAKKYTESSVRKSQVNDRAGKSMRLHVLPADAVVGVLRMLGAVEAAGSRPAWILALLGMCSGSAIPCGLWLHLLADVHSMRPAGRRLPRRQWQVPAAPA